MEEQDRELLTNLGNSIRLGRGAVMDQVTALREEFRDFETRVTGVADASVAIAAGAEIEARTLADQVTKLWTFVPANTARSMLMPAVVEVGRLMALSAALAGAFEGRQAKKTSRQLLLDCAAAGRELEGALASMKRGMRFEELLDIGESALKKVVNLFDHVQVVTAELAEIETPSLPDETPNP